MSHIFISYSTKNASYANKLRDKLLDEGYNVWIDNSRLRASEDWWQSIVLALWSSDVVIVILSEESNISRWVQREITIADQRQKPIFPLLVNGDIDTPNWQIFVRTHYTDVTNGELPPQHFFDKLEQHTKRISGQRGQDITDNQESIQTDIDMHDTQFVKALEDAPSDESLDSKADVYSDIGRQPLMIAGVVVLLVAMIGAFLFASNLNASSDDVKPDIVFTRRVRDLPEGETDIQNLFGAYQDEAGEWEVRVLRESISSFVFPESSPDGEKIAYISNQAGNWDIWLMNSDGSGDLTQLTDIDTENGTQFEWGGISWSPDGKSIAFPRYVRREDGSGDYQLHIMSVDDIGNVGEPLTSAELGITNPAWSPDGQYIVYTLQVEERDEEIEDSRTVRNLWIYDIEADEHRELLISDLDIRNPAWSPDGRFIAFTGDQEDRACEILKIAIDDDGNVDGEPILLTNNSSCDWDPDYSPDGSQIVYYSSEIDSIRIMDAIAGDRNIIAELDDLSGDDPRRDGWPRWVP